MTRHLDTELSSSDWDVMFLHYLGLDHIGHLAGPRSPLIKPKLQEMDNIVRRIYTAMIERVGSFSVKSHYFVISIISNMLTAQICFNGKFFF